MKIGVVGLAIDNHSGSRAWIELSKQFPKFGHEVFVYADYYLSDKKATEELKLANIKIRLIKYPKIKFLSPLLSAFKLKQQLSDDKPDLISSHTNLSFLIGSKLSGIPIFLTYHGTQQDVWFDKIFPKKPTFFDRFLNNFFNIAIRGVMATQILLSDKTISLTKYCADEMKKFYGRVSPFIYWGGAPEHFKVVNKASTRGKIKLLSVSRIVPYKGFHRLIEIVKTKNNVELTIVGSHPDKKYLSYLFKIKPQNVEIKVNIDDKSLAKYYCDTDIYLTCDKFLFWGQPVIEAAQFEIPTIAMDYASAREVIKDGKTGLIAKDDQEFEKYLIELCKNRQKRLRLGKNSKVLAMENTWEKSAQNYLKLFKKWLNK